MIHKEILPKEQLKIYDKLSFFGNIDFANEQNSFMLDDVLRVANFQSLLATQIKATFDRATYKDYKDIDLDNGINKMFEFFGNDFSISQILRNLTYFEDGDLNKLNQNDRKTLIDISRDYTERIMQEIRKSVE